MLSLILPILARAEPLTSDQVIGFMASMTALQAETQFLDTLAQGRQSRDLAGSVPGSMMISDLLAALQNVEASPGDTPEARPAAVVREYGFTDFSEWAQTGDRVLLALMSIRLEGVGSGLSQQLDQIESKIQESSYFSTAQQNRVSEMLSASKARIHQAREVPQQDRDVVRPHLGELQQILDWE